MLTAGARVRDEFIERKRPSLKIGSSVKNEYGDSDKEIESEKRALRDLLASFRKEPEVELPKLLNDARAQVAIGRFIGGHAILSKRKLEN